MISGGVCGTGKAAGPPTGAMTVGWWIGALRTIGKVIVSCRLRERYDEEYHTYESATQVWENEKG